MNTDNIIESLQFNRQTLVNTISETNVSQEALLDYQLDTIVTPTPTNQIPKYPVDNSDTGEIISIFDLGLRDETLKASPRGIAKLFLRESFSGLDYQHFPQITLIENKIKLGEMVQVKDIDITTTCEHQLVLIDGTAKVAYIPNKKLIDLSETNRIVDYFSQRPQQQDRLTQQILVCLQTLLETDNVAVSIDATHFWVKSRGVQDMNSEITTTALGGEFKSNTDTRSEFFS